MTDATEVPEGAALHMGIAEQGKVLALAGEHTTALAYYRQAMRLAVERGDPEVFFRHYLECVIESLELLGSYAEVLEYCDRALDLYVERPPETAVARRDLAHIHQRRGVILLKMGRADEAATAFSAAMEAGDAPLPLAVTLARWVATRLRADESRITSEQRRHDYFSVRPATVDASRALILPPEMLQPMSAT